MSKEQIRVTLDTDVLNAVDRTAAIERLSRSDTINRVLATEFKLSASA